MKPIRKLDEFEIFEEQTGAGEKPQQQEQQTRTVEVRRKPEDVPTAEASAQVYKLPVTPKVEDHDEVKEATNPGMPAAAPWPPVGRNDLDDAPTNPQIDFEFKAALEAARRESAATGLPYPGSTPPPASKKSSVEQVQDELDKEEVTVEVTREHLQKVAAQWKARATKLDFSRRTLGIGAVAVILLAGVGAYFFFAVNDAPAPVVRPQFPKVTRDAVVTPPPAQGIQAPASEAVPAAEVATDTMPPTLKTDLGGSGPSAERAPAVTTPAPRAVAPPTRVVIPPAPKVAMPAKKLAAPKAASKATPAKKATTTSKVTPSKKKTTQAAKPATKSRKPASVVKPTAKKKAAGSSKAKAPAKSGRKR